MVTLQCSRAACQSQHSVQHESMPFSRKKPPKHSKQERSKNDPCRHFEIYPEHHVVYNKQLHSNDSPILSSILCVQKQTKQP